MNNTYFNIGAKYEIVGRITDKTSVVAYMLLDRENNTTGMVEKAIVEQLALNKQIYNCNAQIYNNTVNLKGINCKLSKLPRYTVEGAIIEEVEKPKQKCKADLRLVGKIQSGKTVTKYLLININNPQGYLELDRNMVIQLAKAGRIANVKSQMNGGEAMLRGTSGFNMNQLKTIQI